MPKTGRTFCVNKDNDDCYGKMSLGMVEKPPVTASGQAGFDFEMYRTPLACQQLYQKLPVLVPGTVRYVTFAPVSTCSLTRILSCVLPAWKRLKY